MARPRSGTRRIVNCHRVLAVLRHDRTKDRIPTPESRSGDGFKNTAVRLLDNHLRIVRTLGLQLHPHHLNAQTFPLLQLHHKSIGVLTLRVSINRCVQGNFLRTVHWGWGNSRCSWRWRPRICLCERLCSSFRGRSSSFCLGSLSRRPRCLRRKTLLKDRKRRNKERSQVGYTRTCNDSQAVFSKCRVLGDPYFCSEAGSFRLNCRYVEARRIKKNRPCIP